MCELRVYRWKSYLGNDNFNYHEFQPAETYKI